MVSAAIDLRRQLFRLWGVPASRESPRLTSDTRLSLFVRGTAFGFKLRAMTKGQWRFPISIQDVVRRRPCLRPGKKLRPTSNHEQTQNVQPLRSRCHGRRYRAPPESPTYPLRRTEEDVTVVRIAGIPSFNALENGAKKTGRDFGTHASVVGPAHLDPAPQVKLLEDLSPRRSTRSVADRFPRRRDRNRLQNDARRHQNLPEPEGHLGLRRERPDWRRQRDARQRA